MKYLIFYFLFLAAFISCEHPEPQVINNNIKKNVLIEFLAGVQCVNCHDGYEKLEQILTTQSDNVFIVGIHGGDFSEPIQNLSTQDFRCSEANELENMHQPFLGKPSIVINRNQFDNELYLACANRSIWQTYVDQELEKDASLSIVASGAYNSATRVLTLQTDINAVIDSEGEHFISVFIIENGIQNAQLYLNTVDTNFTHSYVLRDMITKSSGDFLQNNLKANDHIYREFDYTIPLNFNDENIQVIVSIHKNENMKKDVLQSALYKVKM